MATTPSFLLLSHSSMWFPSPSARAGGRLHMYVSSRFFYIMGMSCEEKFQRRIFPSWSMCHQDSCLKPPDDQQKPRRVTCPALSHQCQQIAKVGERKAVSDFRTHVQGKGHRLTVLARVLPAGPGLRLPAIISHQDLYISKFPVAHIPLAIIGVYQMAH